MPMKKILLVDDLRTIIEREKGILSRADFQIFTATSGEEALKLHKAESMDLIVTNLDMPGMSGDTLCSLIRKDNGLRQVSVIVVCSSTSSDLARVKKCNANTYVTKPIRPVQFLEKVSHLLEIPERQSYRVLLKVKIKGTSADNSFFCSSRNISVSGLLIETEKNLQKGDVISCSFFLPKSECIITDAEVMRMEKNEGGSWQYGVRYLDIDAKHRSAIEAFIKTKAGR